MNEHQQMGQKGNKVDAKETGREEEEDQSEDGEMKSSKRLEIDGCKWPKIAKSGRVSLVVIRLQWCGRLRGRGRGGGREKQIDVFLNIFL